MSRKRRSGFKPRQAIKSGNTFVVCVILLGGRVTQVAGFLNRMTGSAGMARHATLLDLPTNVADGSLLGGHSGVKGERKGPEKWRVGGVPLP